MEEYIPQHYRPSRIEKAIMYTRGLFRSKESLGYYSPRPDNDWKEVGEDLATAMDARIINSKEED